MREVVSSLISLQNQEYALMREVVSSLISLQNQEYALNARSFEFTNKLAESGVCT